jgi:hypothetical protein
LKATDFDKVVATYREKNPTSISRGDPTRASAKGGTYCFLENRSQSLERVDGHVERRFQALKRWNVYRYTELTEFKQREANLYGKK